MPKENASYKCLSMIILDSVFKANKKDHPQTKTSINDDLDSRSSETETDNGFDNESDD